MTSRLLWYKGSDRVFLMSWRVQMREIAEIELAIQGGTEKIEQLGEQGKVDESMKELAAIEALKGEKSDKEVSILIPYHQFASLTLLFS